MYKNELFMELFFIHITIFAEFLMIFLHIQLWAENNSKSTRKSFEKILDVQKNDAPLMVPNDLLESVESYCRRILWGTLTTIRKNVRSQIAFSGSFLRRRWYRLHKMLRSRTGFFFAKPSRRWYAYSIKKCLWIVISMFVFLKPLVITTFIVISLWCS